MVRFMYITSFSLKFRQVKRGDADGLFECFKAAMESVEVNGREEKLIGLGCDGTNVNIASSWGAQRLSGRSSTLGRCFLVFGSPS